MTEGKRVLIRVFESDNGPGECDGCGASMQWYHTLKGKKMPMNRDAVPVKSENDPMTGQVIVYFDAADSHWNTCPQRARFK